MAGFDAAACPDVSTLADLTHLLWKEVLPRDAFIVAASMGGLIALLLSRRYGTKEMRGFVNIEGNLAPEDCMFSRRVASYSFDDFSATLFEQIGGIAAVLFAMRNANVSAVIGLDATYGFKGNEKLLADMPDYSPRNMRAAFLDIRRDWDDPASVLNLSAEHGFHYSDRSFITLKKMNHFDFDANAMIAYEFNLPIGASELVNPGRTRATAAEGYQILCHMVLDFFDEKLKGDGNGGHRLQADVARADGGVLKREEALTAPPSAVEFAAIIGKQGFEAATAVVDRYRRDTPDEPVVNETVFNDVGYRLIAEHRLQEAIGIMRLVVYAFPDSANAADSLADAYIAAGQKQAARGALENALRLIAADSTMTPANREFMTRIEQAKLDQLKP